MFNFISSPLLFTSLLWRLRKHYIIFAIINYSITHAAAPLKAGSTYLHTYTHNLICIFMNQLVIISSALWKIDNWYRGVYCLNTDRQTCTHLHMHTYSPAPEHTLIMIINLCITSHCEILQNMYANGIVSGVK